MRNNSQEGILRRAQERALYLLGYRDHSYAELYKKLEKTYDEEVAEQICDKMVEIGLLNDARYAELLAEQLITVKRFGMRKVRWEMRQKGLDANTIEDALFAYEDEDAAERITELIERKYARYLVDERGVKKVMNALARMGHSYHDIKRAVEEYIEMEEDEHYD